MTCYLLTGDVGGTNSRMSLYDASQPLGAKPLVVKYFRNAQYIPVTAENCDDDSLFSKHIILPFLQYCWDDQETTASSSVTTTSPSKPSLPACDSETIILCCLATAGVVMNNRVKMTNLSNLLVDGTAIQNDQSHPYLQCIKACQLINDFVAQGYGCLTLQPSEVKQLYGPTESVFGQTVGPKVCVGAGTGLGECYLTPNNGSNATSYSCFASEGGHVEYAPRNALENKMWEYLQHKFQGKGRISVERVVSGTGLANVYEFLAAEFVERVDQVIHAEFQAAGDEQGRVVGVNASQSPGSLCHEAMQIMMGAYGSEVGSCALKFIPTGGIYVTGGLTPKNIHFIQGQDSEFLKAYLHKGRVSPILEKVPLYAVMVEDLGVRGAHKKAQDMYHEYAGRNTSTSTSAWQRLLKENVVAVAGALALGFVMGMVSRKGT